MQHHANELNSEEVHTNSALLLTVCNLTDKPDMLLKNLEGSA